MPLEPDTVEKLTSIRKNFLKELAKQIDSKKLSYFFSKCWIIEIDEKNKIVILWTPNTFIETQIKKLFFSKLEEVTKKFFTPERNIKLTTFAEFQNISHPLLLNISQLLWKKTSKKKLSKQIKEQLTDKIWILFEKQYTFENFIIGKNNQVAFQSAKKVAQKPWKIINPLFIRWDVWLGKTHLLQAIGNYIISHFPSKVIVYLPTTKFIDEIMHWIKKNKLSDFFEKINQVDILILDDIQFLGEKIKTQEIFHNIFNDLYSKGKQIILSSDRPPKELNLIEARLTSRFSMWMVVKISPPDYITRKQILVSKLKQLWKHLDNKYIDLIAKYVNSNVRELLGALNTVLTKIEILGKIDENIIIETINDLWISTNWNILETNHKLNNENLQNYIEKLLDKYNINFQDLIWKKRNSNIIKARAEFAYFAKNNLWWTLQKIWDFLGGKNHATILHYLKLYQKAK